MTAQPQQTPRFLRQTTLGANEYNRNFQMIDRDILEFISSPEADKVTPLMSKIYLRLLQTPKGCIEREGILRFEGEIREGKWVKAWEQLCKHLCVSSETANKALAWMHEQGIVGYSAFKNGVGIRIFLNRAASSIGIRQSSGGKKILPFSPGSVRRRPASVSEAPFNDPFGDREVLDKDLNPHAPKSGADTRTVDEASSDQPTLASDHSPIEPRVSVAKVATACYQPTIQVEQIIERLKRELEPCVRTAAANAASQAAALEHERTREWLDKHGIPKATRVAQREAYNVLRSHGLVNADAQRARAQSEVGRSSGSYTTPDVRPRTAEEIMEIAETCVALLEAQGKSIEVTLSEISSEGGGWLLPEDAPKVREAAHRLIAERSERK